MKAKLTKIIGAERQVKAKLREAETEKAKLIEDAISSGTDEAFKIQNEADKLISEKIEEKKNKLLKLDEEIQAVVKQKNDDLLKEVTDRIKEVTERIYKEAISND